MVTIHLKNRFLLKQIRIHTAMRVRTDMQQLNEIRQSASASMMSDNFSCLEDQQDLFVPEHSVQVSNCQLTWHWLQQIQDQPETIIHMHTDNQVLLGAVIEADMVMIQPLPLFRIPADSSRLDLAESHVKPISPNIWRAGKLGVAWSRAISSYAGNSEQVKVRKTLFQLQNGFSKIYRRASTVAPWLRSSDAYSYSGISRVLSFNTNNIEEMASRKRVFPTIVVNDMAQAKPISPTTWRAGKRLASSIATSSLGWVEKRGMFDSAPIVVAAANLKKQVASVAADTGDLGGTRERDHDGNSEYVNVRAALAADAMLDTANGKLEKTVIEVCGLPVAWGRATSTYNRKKIELVEGMVNFTNSNPTATSLHATNSGQQERSTLINKKHLDEEIRVAEKTWKAAQEFALKTEEKIKMHNLKVCVCASSMCACVCVCVCVCVLACLLLPLPSLTPLSLSSICDHALPRPPLLYSHIQSYQVANKLKVQLQSLSLIYNKAMSAAAACGNVEWEGRRGSISTSGSDLVASSASGSLLFAVEEEMEEIERECNAAKKRAVQEAKTIVATEDETMCNAREYCEISLCALQLLRREKTLTSLH